jgi:hypothetical protein
MANSEAVRECSASGLLSGKIGATLRVEVAKAAPAKAGAQNSAAETIYRYLFIVIKYVDRALRVPVRQRVKKSRVA